MFQIGLDAGRILYHMVPRGTLYVIALLALQHMLSFFENVHEMFRDGRSKQTQNIGVGAGQTQSRKEVNVRSWFGRWLRCAGVAPNQEAKDGRVY